MANDEALYYDYLDGDSDALAELLSRYDESLNLFIFSFVKNSEDAEDLALDAFAHLAAADKKFRGKSSFKTWLFAIGRNLALQHLRKCKIITSEYTDENAPNEQTPDLPMLKKERYRQLYEAMSRLKGEYRQALYLRYFAEMNVFEISRVLAKKESQVSDLIYRGKKSLKSILVKEGFEYEDDR